LDHEVRRFGVRALLIEPSFTKSKISHSGKDAAVELDHYTVHRGRILEATRRGIATGDDPRLVAEAVFTALNANSPRLRYPVGKGATLSRLRRFLPASIFDRAIRKQFQLD
jgi:short-subunit dehydrogenase